jgi:hypothetical protein
VEVLAVYEFVEGEMGRLGVLVTLEPRHLDDALKVNGVVVQVAGGEQRARAVHMVDRAFSARGVEVGVGAGVEAIDHLRDRGEVDLWGERHG